MQFVEHVRILIFALLIFSALFVVAYTLEMTRLWFACLAVMIVISGAIAVLARWSRIDSGETE
ncbi:hypothetical protein [Archaeoglobus sp.]